MHVTMGSQSLVIFSIFPAYDLGGGGECLDLFVPSCRAAAQINAQGGWCSGGPREAGVDRGRDSAEHDW